MNDPHSIDEYPDVPVLFSGYAGHVSDQAAEALPYILIPDPAAPSRYIEHTVRERPKRRIGF